MAIANIITRGYGPAAAINFVITRGYSIGAAIVSTAALWTNKKRNQAGAVAKRGPGSGGRVA